MCAKTLHEHLCVHVLPSQRSLGSVEQPAIVAPAVSSGDSMPRRGGCMQQHSQPARAVPTCCKQSLASLYSSCTVLMVPR
jgi:hypothetical protein